MEPQGLWISSSVVVLVGLVSDKGPELIKTAMLWFCKPTELLSSPESVHIVSLDGEVKPGRPQTTFSREVESVGE